MKLTELDPRWYAIADQRVGLTFECPHCRETRLGIAFHHAGHEAIEDEYIRAHQGGNAEQFIWALNSAEEFGTLTLSPSIDASASGHWHGFITDGEIR